MSFSAPTTIEGGYNAGCTARTPNASNTVIDFGGGANYIDQFDSSPKSVLAIDGITFKHGNALFIETGADNNCFGCRDNPGELRVSNSRFTGFSDSYITQAGVIEFSSVAGSTTLVNVQFDHNSQGGPDLCEIAVSLTNDTSTTLEYVTADLHGGKDFCFINSLEGGDHDVDIYNSIFWGSDGSLGGIRGTFTEQDGIQDAISVVLVDDLFRGYYGIGPSTVIGQQFPADGAPLWASPATFNYALAPSSAAGVNVAINTGATSVPKGNPFLDIKGTARSIGSAPDLGAYESPYNDSDLFTVTNTSDCNTPGCGSLRDAINLATISSNPSVSIRFSIPSACPAVIVLGSPLPDITKSMQIDGNTQSGAITNSDLEAFNATLCVVIKPSTPVPYYAMRVLAASSKASLYLSGIGFGAFPIGVELLGGKNHQIVGNQFGGLINNDTYQLYGSSVADIYMDVPGGQTTIGSSDPAKRNAFLNAASFTDPPASAIQVGYHVNSAANACQIVGNNIGVQDDGTFASRNTDFGIYIQGNGCAVRDNRIVGLYKDAIYIDNVSGGGNNNVVQNNIIGLVPYGFDLSTVNSGVGIRVRASHNVIGFAPIPGGAASFYGNRIENMDGGGVVVVSGTGNTIRGNVMFDNGPGGDGMSIDLGGSGTTPNDYGDTDSGANNLQNFPVLHSVTWATPPHVGNTNIVATLSGTLNTFIGAGFYQIDAYYAHGCNVTGRGSAERWIGSVDYVYVPAGSFNANFSVNVVVPDFDPANGRLSLTATNNNNAEGSTSELSTCFAVDTIFRDGADGQ
ncbi:MAG TPA: choice-of-anchor Q domain-containing protein [Rudaea sp.]